MVAIFSFDDVDGDSSRKCASAQHDTQRSNTPAQFEKEWPRLGGSASPALKPAWGLRASPQPAITSMFTVDGSSPRAGKTTGTAKGGLAMLLASSRSSSRAPSDAGDVVAERAAEAEASTSRGRKKKNKNKKAKAEKRGAGISTAGLEKPDFLLPRTLKASPSTGSLRGDFFSSPNKPEEKSEPEYTWGTPARGETSPTSSICSSPPRSGLSSLLSSAHPGDIVTVAGTETPVSSDNGEEDEEPMIAYEVAIDEDYVSKDVDSRLGSRSASPVRKKMTADDFETLKCLGKGT
jgi:hypothetical protein